MSGATRPSQTPRSKPEMFSAVGRSNNTGAKSINISDDSSIVRQRFPLTNTLTKRRSDIDTRISKKAVSCQKNRFKFTGTVTHCKVSLSVHKVKLSEVRISSTARREPLSFINIKIDRESANNVLGIKEYKSNCGR